MKTPRKIGRGISFPPRLLQTAQAAAVQQGISLSAYVLHLVRQDLTKIGRISKEAT